MAGTQKNNGQAQIQIVWENLSETPVMAANTFLLQYTGHEFVLSIGFAVAPDFAKPEDAAGTQEIPAKAIGRICLTASRLNELVSMFQQALSETQSTIKQ